MNLHTELPERATLGNRLAATIRAACELMELRVGYRVELAALEPIDRGGCVNLRAYWRPIRRDEHYWIKSKSRPPDQTKEAA